MPVNNVDETVSDILDPSPRHQLVDRRSVHLHLGSEVLGLPRAHDALLAASNPERQPLGRRQLRVPSVDDATEWHYTQPGCCW